MRRLFFLVFAAFLICCSPNSSTDNSFNNEADKKGVAQAEENMFNAIKTNDPNFWKTVSDSYITINADGIMVNKEQVFADSARSKLFGLATYKYLDKKIRVYGDVGIVNGRAQAFMNGQMVVEFLYTAIFVKQNGKWMYTSWQGTISKDSPPAPPMPKN